MADGPERGEQEALVDALVQTAFTVMTVLTRVAAAHELSLSQLRVLGILRDRRPRMAELAAFLGLEKSTMSGLVGRAEQRGLVERRADPADARATGVVMTKAGLKLAEQIHREVGRDLVPLTGRLSPPQRERAAALLAAMLSAGR